MVKKKVGRCKNKLKEKGRAKSLLLWKYGSLFFLDHLFSAQSFLFIKFVFEQDAVEAADLRNYSPRTRDSLSCWNPDSIGFNLIENVLCHICQKERPGAVLVFMTGWDDINALKEQLQANPLLGDPSKVLLLACHGSMASSEQVLQELLQRSVSHYCGYF